MLTEDTVPDFGTSRTIIGSDGRVLVFSYDDFLEKIVEGGCCFVCGEPRNAKPFNDEHIIPKWILRKFKLFNKQITLPTGEKRTYDRYKISCCEECNSLLGQKIETPISKLIDGSYDEVAERIKGQGYELLFSWMALLFFKNHLKDLSVALDRNPARSTGYIGEIYDWGSFHHVHAIARSAYTQAFLLPDVIGSICVYEIDDGMHVEAFDYLTMSFAKVVMVRLGRIGIVAVLDDAGASAWAWAHKLDLINAPISAIQLKEVTAMLAVANDDLIERPRFGTIVANEQALIFARLPRDIRLPPFDPEKFGEYLLFALREVIAQRGIEVDGTKDQRELEAKIRTGYVRFLTDEAGHLRPAGGQASPADD